MINMAVAEDDMGDVGGRQPQKRQLARCGLTGGKADEGAEAGQIVTRGGGAGRGGIGGREAGVEEDAPALIGFQKKAGDADGAFAGADVEQAEVEDGKAGYPAGREGGWRCGRAGHQKPARVRL